MSLLSAFLEAWRGDPPKPVVRPTAAEFADGEVSRAFMEAIRDRRRFQMERDCYKAELLRRGYSERNLKAMLEMHGRVLKAEVKRA